MASSAGVSWSEVEGMALAYPGVQRYPEGDPHATQCRLGKKHLVFMSREPGALCLRPVFEDEQRFLMETQPNAFFLTEHYRNWNCILVRLENADRSQLAELIDQAWRRIALKREVAKYDQACGHDLAPAKKNR